MRKIEKQMLEEIQFFVKHGYGSSKKYWKLDNTTVRWNSLSESEDLVDVYLYDNRIARFRVIEKKIAELTIHDCGYRTATTKSRLNAILSTLTPVLLGERVGIWQEKGLWWVGTYVGYSAEQKPRLFTGEEVFKKVNW